MRTPGQRIRQRRKDLGFNRQGVFARLVGCSQGTLSEIESGITKFQSAKVLAKMCEVLRTTDRWILYGEEGDISIPTQEEELLLSAYRNMTDEARQNLLGIINSLHRK